MSSAPFDILTTVSDILLDSGGQDAAKALKALCMSSRDLFCYLYHKIHRKIDLSDRERCSGMLYLVEHKLVEPGKAAELQICLSNDSQILRKVMRLFLDSPQLTLLHLLGPEDRTCHHDLISLAIDVLSTARKPLAVILIGMISIPIAFVYHAQHIELRHSYFAAVAPNTASERVSPLRSISCSTGAGQSLFNALFLLQIEIPNLTHLLLHFKPSANDDIIDDTLTTVLDFSNKLEEITVVYEPNNASLLSDSSCVRTLEQVLIHVASRHSHPLALQLQFNCPMVQAFEVLLVMDDLEGFHSIVISAWGTETFARALLKCAYNRFIAGGANKHLRVDRVVLPKKAERALLVFGTTAQDDLTVAPISRARSHRTVCPWVTRLPLINYEEHCEDDLVPVNTL